MANQLGVGLTLGAVAAGKLVTVNILPDDAPLWFAVLGEAEANGGQLGPVGGLLVAVSLLRMLDCDEESYVHAAGWQPVLFSSAPGQFTVADLMQIGIDERNDHYPPGP